MNRVPLYAVIENIIIEIPAYSIPDHDEKGLRTEYYDCIKASCDAAKVKMSGLYGRKEFALANVKK